MSQHIAIVEDEPAIRENYADAFRRAGYRVSARMKSTPDSSTGHTGFRCVRSGPDPAAR